MNEFALLIDKLLQAFKNLIPTELLKNEKSLYSKINQD